MNSKMHHIQCSENQIGKYVFLPGDPDRVHVIAQYLDNSVKVAQSREFVTYTGYLNGVKVSVTSTGIGGPSAAIAIEELIKLGAHTFIRIGTCGGINPTLNVGSAIIATGAIRTDGTSTRYLPIAFPAVPDFELTKALQESAQKQNCEYTMAVVESKDSYYGQHEPESMPIANELLDNWKIWQLSGAAASEMEASTLFTVAQVRKVRCAGIFHLVRNREKEKIEQTEPMLDTKIENTIKIAIEAMQDIIANDKF